MFYRSMRISAVVLMLGLSACSMAQPTPTSAVALAFKFTPGQILRYKMVMDVNMVMKSNLADAGQTPPVAATMVVVTRQRVVKVLPGGDAQIDTVIESMHMNIMGSVIQYPTKSIPVITSIMSTSGQVKSTKGLEKMNKFGGANGLMNMLNMGSLNQNSTVLPSGPVHVGDKWTQDIPIPMGGEATVQCTLLSADTKLAGGTVAVFGQNVDGRIDMGQVASYDKTGMHPNHGLELKGTVNSNGTVYFSAEKGRMIRTDGYSSMQISSIVSAIQGGKDATMTIDAQIKFEMFLLPEKQ